MAKVKIEKRCEGPFNWETKDGIRTIVPLGICGEKMMIEYDDEDSWSDKFSTVWQSLGYHWACVRCSASGNGMIDEQELRRARLAKSRFNKGKHFKADKGKEYLF